MSKKVNIANERGVAILMVMTSITLLILVLATFTYDTKVNKLRLYNHQERIQAKLDAEAGLRFAMLRLDIYQQARNLLEKNKNLKDIVSPQIIQSILTTPFFYPIPPIGDMNVIQKTALEEFNDGVLLEGSLNFSIRPVTGFMNPNNLLVDNKQTDEAPPSPAPNPEDKERDDKATDPNDKAVNMRAALSNLIEQKFTWRRANDDVFNSLYAHLDPEQLIDELHYYISPEGKFQKATLGEVQTRFNNLGIRPKFAPLSSIEELNLLPLWDDEIISMFKEHLTPHADSSINVEQITKGQLQVLFPGINETELKEFFEYRDGNSEKEIDPHPIKSVAQFEQIVTNILGFITPQDYKDRIKTLKEAGITLGVSNLLFEVTSTGRYNRAQYRLKAIVNIPVYERIIQPATPTSPTQPTTEKDEGGVFNPDDADLQENPNDKVKESDKVKKEIEYLPPRIQEIING